MAYVTVDGMKGYLKERLGTVNDALLQSFLDQASTACDRATGRFFDSKTATVDFDTVNGDAYGRRLLLRKDLQSVTSLLIDRNRSGGYPTTVPATAFRLFPLDSALKEEPYDEVRMIGGVFLPSPSPYPGVRITGDWGWADVPATIVGAVQIIASRLVARINAPLGAGGSPDSPLGVSQVMGDLELALLLKDYIMPV